MESEENSLLQEIQQVVLCFYLSDLYSAEIDERAKKIISKIPNDKYSIAEWNEAVSYIKADTCIFHTVEEAKRSICS